MSSDKCLKIAKNSILNPFDTFNIMDLNSFCKIVHALQGTITV